MKRYQLIASLVLILSTISVEAQTFDFRKTRWGMNLSSVKSAESNKLLSESQRKLVYDCVLADNETKVIYVFSSSDKLTRAKYFVTPDYINMIFYIRDFKLFEGLMTQKYGKPLIVSPKAINKSSVPEEEWAAFLSAGELQVEVKWDLPTTEIMLTLSKIGEKPAIQIDYLSKELSKQDLKERAAAVLNDL